MIKRTQQYRFPGSAGATAINYTVTTDNSRTSVTPSSGTVAPGTVVEFEFLFEDENQFNATFTITTTDDKCATPATNSFNIANPCTTLDGTITNVPSSDNPLIFNLLTTGGQPPYSVQWVFDNGLFDEVQSSSRNLELRLDGRFNNSQNTTISAVITDANGCTETVSLAYEFCQPVAGSQFHVAECIPSQTINGFVANAVVGGILLGVGECAGTTTVWNTLDLDYNTSKLLVVVDDNNRLTVYAKAGTTAANYTINYTVQNSLSIESTTGQIIVSVPVCSTANISTTNPKAVSQTIKLLPTDSTSTVKYVSVEDLIFTPLAE